MTEPLTLDWLFGRSTPIPFSGCWAWDGARMVSGYGYIRRAGGHYLAHRVAYELTKGRIPEDLEIDHLCRVRCCVNPDHLEAVTRRTNILRGDLPGVAAQLTHTYGHWHSHQTHCRRGHEFTPENTYTRPGLKNRECRVCRQIDGDARREAAKVCSRD